MYVAIMGVHGECGHACVVHMDFGRLQNIMVLTHGFWVNLATVDFSIFFSLQRNTNRHTYPNTFLIIDKLHTQPMCF
jgi:hypothetical protein